MTNRIDHSNCRHRADSKGRAACRNAGGPQGYELQFRINLRREADKVCSTCFVLALEVATENLLEEGSITDPDDTDALIQARDYLYDRSALTACTEHQDLL